MSKRGSAHRPKRTDRKPAHARAPAASTRWAPPAWLGDLSRRWTSLVGTVAGALLTWIVGTLAGVQPIPGTVPIFNLVHDRPAAVLLVGSVVFFLTVAAWFAAHQPEGSPPRTTLGSRWYQVRPVHPTLVAGVIAVATLSTSTSVAVVAVVLGRPAWCPSELCPSVPGPHDQFLAADFNAFESAAYVLTGDLRSYTIANLPDGNRRDAIAAQRVLAGGDSAEADDGYHLSLKVTSLQRGRLGMVIGGVAVVVESARPPPDQLRVLLAGAPLQYRLNPYRGLYDGQARGDVIVAPYAGQVRLGYVQLRPGESDELSLQIQSSRLVDLRFRVRVLYRPVTEDSYRTLELPYVFEVVFSDQLNWQQFQFSAGRLAPG